MYYVDTCIWVDYWEERESNGEDLGEMAVNFFTKMRGKIVISNFVIKELRKLYGEEVNEILSTIKPKIVNYSKNQLIEAKELSSSKNVPFGDALHFVFVRDNDLILITRDKHFYELPRIFFHPEDLI